MEQTVIIRKETLRDYKSVFDLTQEAFETLEISDHDEGQLVEKLRKAPSFIDELSIVAELNGELVGHILFTPMLIENGDEKYQSLVLGPVSVLPEFQKRGIGGQLIRAGHQKAWNLDFNR